MSDSLEEIKGMFSNPGLGEDLFKRILLHGVVSRQLESLLESSFGKETDDVSCEMDLRSMIERYVANPADIPHVKYNGQLHFILQRPVENASNSWATQRYRSLLKNLIYSMCKPSGLGDNEVSLSLEGTSDDTIILDQIFDFLSRLIMVSGELFLRLYDLNKEKTHYSGTQHAIFFPPLTLSTENDILEYHINGQVWVTSSRLESGITKTINMVARINATTERTIDSFFLNVTKNGNIEFGKKKYNVDQNGIIFVNIYDEWWSGEAALREVSDLLHDSCE